jgi:hypothetical protein
MATPSNIIRVPKPSRSSYNPNRPLSKNTLLLNQVKHFQEIESRLPPEQRTGVDPQSIQTEAQASDYVHKMTLILHPRAAGMGGKIDF